MDTSAATRPPPDTAASTATDPALVAMLTRLAGLGLRMAGAVTEVTEVEQRMVTASARWLPAEDATPASYEEATRIGLGIDAAEAAVAHANPRVATLSQAFERLARTVRRTVALARRLEQGWPLPGSDNRRAMLLRQIARRTGEAIHRRTDGDAEAAERLFADLDARLDDPAFTHDLLDCPVEEMVRRLSRAIGLPPDDAAAGPPEAAAPAHRRGPLLGDTPPAGALRRS